MRNIEDGVSTLGADGSTGVTTKSGQATKDSVAGLLVPIKDQKGAPDATNSKATPNFIYSIFHDLVCRRSMIS